MICLDLKCAMPSLADGGSGDACVPAEERCDGVDNDCDGMIDEATTLCESCEGDCFLQGFPGPCSSTLDIGLDETTDRTSVFLYEGFVQTGREDDRDNDGTREFRVEWILDSSGQVVGETIFESGTQTGSSVRVVENGRLIRIDYDRVGNDGVIDRVLHYIYEDEVWLRLEVDDLADGSIDSVFTNSYDESGLRTQRERTRGGPVDQLTRYTYDEVGNLLTLVTDYTNDGTFDQIQRYDYSCWNAAD